MELRIDEPLQLRTLVGTDATVLFAVVDANRSYLRRWLPWLDVNTTHAASLQFIQDQTAKATREEAVPFGVFHLQELVGVVGYNWIDEQRAACGLGYWLSEHHQRKGIAYRCVAAVVRHAFEVMHMSTVEIHIATQNQRSRRLAERLGFRAVGTREQAEWLYDHHVDHVVYELARGNAPQPAVADGA
jgi:ribosomal-protein-serine acetyltransferase